MLVGAEPKLPRFVLLVFFVLLSGHPQGRIAASRDANVPPTPDDDSLPPAWKWFAAAGALVVAMWIGMELWMRSLGRSGMMGGGNLWGLGVLAVMLLMMFGMMWMMRQRHTSHSAIHERRGQAESAREILDRRYAAGEISREEFERIRNDLGRGR